MEGVLPERNHAVKFVAVYDNGTDSHAVPPMIAALAGSQPLAGRSRHQTSTQAL
jgi:hypothetical protein